MRLFKLAAAFAAALSLAACSSPPPISSNPVTNVGNLVNGAGGTNNPVSQFGGTVIQGLQDASFNFDNAMAVGALPANDPASPCVHSILQDAGADVVNTPTGETPVVAPAGPGTSFTPKVSDLISAGSVAYIYYQQIKGLQGGGGLTIPQSCTQIIGMIVVDAAKQMAGGLSGGILGIGTSTGGGLPLGARAPIYKMKTLPQP